LVALIGRLDWSLRLVASIGRLNRTSHAARPMPIESTIRRDLLRNREQTLV